MDQGTAYVKEIGLTDSVYGEIIKSACNYILSHRQYFGATILETGCGAGYMTGFLARVFSNAKITTIDDDASLLETARERLAGLQVGAAAEAGDAINAGNAVNAANAENTDNVANVNNAKNATNVEFVNCSLRDVNGRFDTIFSMGTLGENSDLGALPFEGEPLLYQFAACKAVTREYTRLLADHLKDSGTLCVFERIDHDPLLCGWLLEMNDNSCGIIPESYKEISCDEAGVAHTFQVFAARKGYKNKVKQILDLWYEPISQYNSDMTSLRGWQALDYLNRNAGSLIRGVRAYDRETGHQAGRFALFTDRDSDQMIYLLISAGDVEHTSLISHSWDMQKELLDKIEDFIHANGNDGIRYEEIGPEDQIVEGRIKIGFVKKH